MVSEADKGDNDILASIGKHLVESYGLAQDQVEQMVQLSATSIAEALTQAEQALADNNLTALSAAAHKTKGVLLSIGLNDAADLALAIEQNAKERKTAAYQQLLHELQENIRPLTELDV